jgi:hypothetical protein
LRRGLPLAPGFRRELVLPGMGELHQPLERHGWRAVLEIPDLDATGAAVEWAGAPGEEAPLVRG